MDQALRDKAVAIIESCQDLTLATNREDGFPQATVVSFAHDGLTLYFGTGSESQKTRNLTRDPRASVAMTAPYDSWQAIRGVSMAVKAHRIEGEAEKAEVGRLFFARFPQLQTVEAVDPALVAFFRLTPVVMSVLDYTQGFGHCETVRVSDNDITESLGSMAHRWLAKVD